jgi:hypothetical protein
MLKQLAKRVSTDWVDYVFSQFNDHLISEEQACDLLQIKRASLYKLRKRWLRCELKKIPFNLNPSGQNQKRALSKDMEDFLHQELSYVKKDAHYFKRKFNFAYLSEQIFKRFALSVQRNTIRRFAIREGYYKQTSREKKKPCIRFEMDSVGALFQHDTSRHVWLPLSGRYHDLIMTKDDHTRFVTGFSLRETESAWEHISLTRRVFEQYGRPLAYYVDRHSIFKFNLGSECVHYTRRISEEEGKIQFKRVLNALDISVLYAQDAQSKGKIEKGFDYFQRRLPFECERYKVKTVGEAMKILTDLVDFYNHRRVHLETEEIPGERWKRAVREKRSKLRPLPQGQDLDNIFSLHFLRTVYSDGTIKFQGRSYKINQMPGKKVIVAFIPAKKIMALSDNQKVWQYHFEGYR